MFLAMFDGFKGFDYLSARKKSSGSNFVVGVARRVREIQRFPLPKDSHNDIAVHVLRGSLSRVHKLRGHEKLLPDGQG